MFVDSRVVDEAALCRQTFEEDILTDREPRNEVTLLMDHSNPSGERLARRAECDLAAVELHGAGVRPVYAGDDLDQCRLSSPVLSH
jgi:hypothetical protein